MDLRSGPAAGGARSRPLPPGESGEPRTRPLTVAPISRRRDCRSPAAHLARQPRRPMRITDQAHGLGPERTQTAPDPPQGQGPGKVEICPVRTTDAGPGLRWQAARVWRRESAPGDQLGHFATLPGPWPGPWLRSRLSRPNRSLPSPATTQLNDTISERWIQAERPTEEGRGYPNVMVPGQEWRRTGLLHPAPATEQDQTKLYGFVVNSWSDKVLSVQRIWTRTRTR